MSSRLAAMVDIYDEDHTFRHHDSDSRFHLKTPDIEWLTVLGNDEPAWVVIRGDGRILRNRAERQALREANLTFFCMAKAWTHMSIHEIVWKFLRVWPEITENAAVSITTPKIFEVAGGHSTKIFQLGKTKDI
jgi:hypothetical protein